MACFVNEISVIIFILLGVVSVVLCQWEIDRDDNIEPFSLLCRIYNVAKNPPINHVDLEEPHKIVEEITALNASLVNDKRYNETEEMANGVEAKINSAATKESVVAQLSINQITQKAHTILEEIKKMNAAENIRKAKAEFAQVIFGDNGNESDLCHATVKGVGDRATACGKPGEGTRGNSAGKNLVVDFFCLCSMRTESSEGAKQACGFFVGKIDKYYGWSEQDPWGSSTMWASIKGGCGKHMQQHPKSTAEARHILDQFLKHLKTGGVYRVIESNGKNVEGSDRKEGMLGIGVVKKNGGEKGPVCDGKNGKVGNNPSGVCVYYGKESELDNIPWLKPFQTALASVDTVNNQTASIQRAVKKLQMLLHRAEEIYETAKVITEIQKPVGLPAALQNVSGNLTSYNTTRIRSYNPHPYLIPAWAVLLL
ncbi:Variant surface glycoprotein [Trypanosoma congolense IL3000]|uniref:Variant surface glycoprotein n=1 Tax=Trypanosoma congolense (strain IL3000) TaxID=1068625 RepID=F9WB90_TRYCI|nr:Variant surface glycoprotein [Trypanosoma congolense IL3000]